MYKCKICNSTDIESKLWVKININEIVQPISKDDNVFWCCNCEYPVEVYEDNKLNNKLNERNCD